MNILVTGANGQLGHEMQIVAKQSNDRYFFSDICDGYHQLDITDEETISKFVDDNHIQCIVNCAAWTNVDAAEDPANRRMVDKLNAEAPANLARVMSRVGGLLIHISTDYVFGAEPYNTPCNEMQMGTPTGIYGLTKLQGEQAIVETFADNPGAFVILRTAWLYSEYGRNFLKTMLNLTASKPVLKVVADQAGTPTYALDLAKAIAAIIDDYKASDIKPYPKSGIYHFSNEGVCSWFDFATMIRDLAYTRHDSPFREQYLTHCDIQPCTSAEFPSPVRRPAYSVLDKTKIKETFGIHIPYWTHSLQSCLANLKETSTKS